MSATSPVSASRRAHDGHVLVLGEEHDLRLAGRASEELEQERLHGRVELLEGIVEQQGHALAADGPRPRPVG